MDNLLVNFVDRIREFVKMEKPVVEVKDRSYWEHTRALITEPLSSAKDVRSLSSVVDYIKSNPDKLSDDVKLIVNVEDANEVNVFSSLNNDQNRNYYLSCKLFPFGFNFDRFFDTESFIIGIQTYFEDNDDKMGILSYVGNVRDEEIMERKDDGVTQELNVKKGISGVERKALPNPVKLMPKRVFPELSPIESQFILRARKGAQGVEFALFDSDKEVWRMKAINETKGYLYSKLSDCNNVVII